MRLGTPAYMSPEQHSGQSHLADGRSDQWALGVMLYEMLTGKRPFQASNASQLAYAVQRTEPKGPSKLDNRIPKDLETICLKCLQKPADKRYASCQELAEDLRRWIADEPITARRIGLPERFWRWCKRQPVVAALSAAAMLLIVLVAVISTIGWMRVVRIQRERALAQIDALRRAEITQVPYLIEGLAPVRAEIVPRLEELIAQPDLTEKEHLRLSLALLSGDSQQVDYLRGHLLDVEPDELLVIRSALVPYCKNLVKDLWTVALDPQLSKNHRFRAACVLAAFDPQGADWAKVAEPTVDVLVIENALRVGKWMEALQPVAKTLSSPLKQVFRDTSRSESERSLAAGILANYAADRPDVLADLLADAEGENFTLLLTALRRHGERAATGLMTCLAEKPADEKPDNRTQQDIQVWQETESTVFQPAGESGNRAVSIGPAGYGLEPAEAYCRPKREAGLFTGLPLSTLTRGSSSAAWTKSRTSRPGGR